MALARDQATPSKRAAHHRRRTQGYVVIVRGPVPENLIDKISTMHALAVEAREEAGRQRR